MTEPERLLGGSGDDVEVALLRSALPDRPSRKAMRTTLLALGVGSGVTAATSTASAATAGTMAAAKSSSVTALAAAKTAASIPPAAAAASQAGIAVLVKWVGIAGIAAFATWGAVSQLPANDAPQENQAEPMVPPPLAAPPLAAPPEAPPSPPVAEVTAETVAAAPAECREGCVPPAPTSDEAAPPKIVAPRIATGAVVPPSTAKPPSLGDEVALLDRAQKHMEDDPEAALAALEAYREGFKGGVLAQESELLRIDALSRSGKHQQARAAAAAFLAQHPKSPLAGRVRKLLE